MSTSKALQSLQNFKARNGVLREVVSQNLREHDAALIREGGVQVLRQSTPKSSITEPLAARFRAFSRVRPEVFHVVLDDGNFQDHFAASTLAQAIESGDAEAIQLAKLLAVMSTTQRRKLSHLIGRVSR